MKRVVIAPAATTAALALLTLFAAGGALIGALMIAAAGNIARQNGGSPAGIIAGGAVVAAIGVLVLLWTLRQWGAVTRIDVGDGWTLHARRGAATPIAPGTPVELALRCRRVIYTLQGIPRVRDVVDGTLRAGALTRRLAASGPHTYADVLRALGITAAPPRRGEDARYTTRA